ncbi:GntR family transcriptional regulator [Brevibacterium luteolum]|uniref:GntR family transcriptional regulator n=1 Tax=Brevibacterium luteolum TaxID=199591 RepID=A0A849AQ37_9MICO|nr:GntR family transcriptional regulator [Brevibacterium luteolum]NNG77975.1 GntR family transcriptional regulator [Brevibacterium luteolum]
MLRDDLVYLIERNRAEGVLKLPPERELAQQLGVARETLRKQLAELVRSGHLVKRLGRGGGTFIQDEVDGPYTQPDSSEKNPPLVIRRSLNSVEGVPTFLTDQGFKATTAILKTEERFAWPRERESLKLDRGDRVLTIKRLRSANGTPLSLEQMTLPADIFPDLLKRDLRSIYALMYSDYGMKVDTAKETITVARASSAAAYQLTISLGDPLFDISRIAYAKDGRPIEQSRDLFRADITKLTVTSNHKTDPTCKCRVTADRTIK